MDVNPGSGGPKAATRSSAVSPAAAPKCSGGIELREIDNPVIDETSLYPARPSVFGGENEQREEARGVAEAKPNAPQPIASVGVARGRDMTLGNDCPEEERESPNGSLV